MCLCRTFYAETDWISTFLVFEGEEVKKRQKKETEQELAHGIPGSPMPVDEDKKKEDINHVEVKV